MKIAVVLSAGGLRGAAHVGVLRELVRQGVPIHAIVGVSAGAIVAAYYAAVGLGFEELIADAERFRGRHLLAHSLNVQLGYRLEAQLGRFCGVIPERLGQLASASFDRLHHGVERLGIVCHDLTNGRPRYFSTGSDAGVSLADAVLASASIPRLFPAVPVCCDGEPIRLTDGGVSDGVPLAFARAGLGATHVVVSDCRWIGRGQPPDDTTVWVRPSMPETGTLWSPARGLISAVRDGAAALTPQALERISNWFALNSA
ncbi:MAG TPA: patatin-like phospholipase family protein [Vicinamibacterales bacterium]